LTHVPWKTWYSGIDRYSWISRIHDSIYNLSPKVKTLKDKHLERLHILDSMSWQLSHPRVWKKCWHPKCLEELRNNLGLVNCIPFHYIALFWFDSQ
jgi:hypothetical protein